MLNQNCLFTGKFTVHLLISYTLPDMTFSFYPCLLVNPCILLKNFQVQVITLTSAPREPAPPMTLNCVNLSHHLLWISVPSQQPVCSGGRTGDGSSLSLQSPGLHTVGTQCVQYRLYFSSYWSRKGWQRERGSTICTSPSPVWIQITCCLVTKSCPTLCDPHGLQHTRLPCPSAFPGICSDSCPLSWWCHPNISSSVTPFSCTQSFPASGSFPMSQFFASGGPNY